MAAAPETQRQAAGVSVTGYSPVVTQLSTPNMGSPGAGQLWAQVGRTAMEAGTALMNSPLNPAVREELQARYKSAQEGINQFNVLDKTGLGPLMYSVDQLGRAAALAPGAVQDRTMATQILSRLGIGPPIGTGGGEVKTPAPTEPGTGTGEEQKKTEEQPKEEAKPKPPTAEEAGRGQASTVRSPATGSNMYAVYGGPPPPEAPSQPYYSASTETGPIPTTSTTEGVERQPAAEYRAQYEQAQKQKQLADWQAQNAHPVASAPAIRRPLICPPVGQEESPLITSPARTGRATSFRSPKW
jgi:hypothetical protein